MTSTIRLEKTDDGLALLRFDKGSANAIDPAFVEDLLAVTAQVADDASVRGVLLCSSHPKVFCPGLDLRVLFELDRGAMGAFMTRFSEAVVALYALRKPVVAALSGHAVAGGCVIALACDLRVLKRGGAQIGLNEVKVGVPLPWSVALLLEANVAPTALTRVALLGNNFADEEALAVGLVDALADAEGFEDACLARLRELCERDAFSYGVTKSYLRAQATAAMREREAELLPEWLDGWFQPATRERIQKTLLAMKK